MQVRNREYITILLKVMCFH